MKNIKIILILFILTTSLSGIFAQNNYKGKLGYGFSPEGHPFDYSHMGAFLQEVSDMCNGGIVLANGSWRDSFPASGIIPKFQKDICNLQPSPFPYTDMVVFAWGTPTQPYTLYLDVPGDSTNNWTNSTARTLFLKMLISAADSLKPSYFFIGNEISFYWEQDSADYLNWVGFYNQAYDSVKIHSPSSKIGTVFNYEHLSGNGKLIGWNTPYWNALNIIDTSKIDILGLTVYPFFNYAAADTIPLNYLTPLFNKMGNKPIAITETGWPADSLLANWYCSPQQQVNYVNKLFAIINGQNVEAVNWLYLYYLMDKSTDENKISASIALHDSMGNVQPAMPVWLTYCSTANEMVNYTGKPKTNVIVYPNPFSSTATIEISYNMYNASLMVFNIFGEIVKHQCNLNGRIIQVNKNNLSRGVYFFQLQENAKILTGKFIVE
jgi:hypothetical protein